MFWHLSYIHALIWPLPFINPELRFLHNRTQLVQIRLYLLVIIHILAGDQQLHLFIHNVDAVRRK